MNSKQKKVLAAVFVNPVSGTLVWAEVESMLVAIGCQVVEGNGSRIKIILNGDAVAVHRPHPGKEAKHYQIRAVREFLSRNGVNP
jgi:HicA toxin of bacterial toxin-antitoxin,